MIWMDYTIESAGNGKAFRVKGDWDGEVMGKAKDGSPKDNWLYKPGDVFIVNEHGWLIKSDEVNALLLRHESNKSE